MIRRPLFLLATAGLLALASCGVKDASTGELNNGRFSYLCVDSSDGACEGSTGNVAIPGLIAVGGAFDLEYAGDSEGSSPVQVEPASETMISGATGHFKFLIPGVGAVLSRNTSGVVADFVHLRGAKVDHLDVAGPSSTGAVTEVDMTTDNDVTLRVVAKDDTGSTLAGALPYVWTSSNSKIVSLGLGPKNRATLKGLAAGTTTVEVSLSSGLKMSVVVVVKQGKDPSTSSSSGQGGSGGSGTTTTGAGGAGGGA